MKRGHISLTTKLAAALACLLPQDQRDKLRHARADPQAVLSLFEWDHVKLHSLDPDDHWSNIDPKLVEVHAEKTRQDISIAAKIKRLIKKTAANMSMETPHSIYGDEFWHKEAMPKPKHVWPSRKIASRPFQKRAKKV